MISPSTNSDFSTFFGGGVASWSAASNEVVWLDDSAIEVIEVIEVIESLDQF
jgi:hypothetical protein